ncbi:hypothetical protein BJ878DRAFT_500433 [Calycina marina]|uniref:Uncharacterized protein n=1 Tax=Calycina marina TaxID=1763456 RepID=A0A9P7Z5T3_9HELO|nr:hypothetical protein BJ878DRAFT_500433 [Calycina marina]
MSQNGQTSAVSGGTGATNTPANTVGNVAGSASGSSGSRKSSQSSSKFSGLMDQKRNSTDATARRQSFADQAPKSGFVGNMWNNLIKGHK